MFDIQAVKRDLDIKQESSDNQSNTCAKDANPANLKLKVSTISTISTISTPTKLKNNTIEPTVYLSSHEESRVRAWLEHIQESDADIIHEIIERCRHNEDAKKYFLMRSKEAALPVARRVTCGGCSFYKPTSHPHLGHCDKKQRESISGLWDTDKRFCTHWSPLLSN